MSPPILTSVMLAKAGGNPVGLTFAHMSTLDVALCACVIYVKILVDIENINEFGV